MAPTTAMNYHLYTIVEEEYEDLELDEFESLERDIMEEYKIKETVFNEEEKVFNEDWELEVFEVLEVLIELEAQQQAPTYTMSFRLYTIVEEEYEDLELDEFESLEKEMENGIFCWFFYFNFF